MGLDVIAPIALATALQPPPQKGVNMGLQAPAGPQGMGGGGMPPGMMNMPPGMQPPPGFAQGAMPPPGMAGMPSPGMAGQNPPPQGGGPGQMLQGGIGPRGMLPPNAMAALQQAGVSPQMLQALGLG